MKLTRLRAVAGCLALVALQALVSVSPALAMSLNELEASHIYGAIIFCCALGALIGCWL